MLLVAPINACATLVVFIIDLLRPQNTYSYHTNIKNAINIHVHCAVYSFNCKYYKTIGI